MKKPCSEMFCLRNQDITDAKAFFHLFFMSNSGYFIYSHDMTRSRDSCFKPSMFKHILPSVIHFAIKDYVEKTTFTYLCVSFCVRFLIFCFKSQYVFEKYY